MRSPIIPRARRSPPQLPGDFFQGVARQLRQDPLGTLEAASRLGEVVLLRAGFERIYLLREPEHIQHVLQDNHRGYTRQTGAYPRTRAILGNGLLNLEGDAWLARRRLLQPAFSRQSTTVFADVIVRATTALVDRLRPQCEAGQAVNVLPELLHTLLSIMGWTLLGRELGPLAEKVHLWTSLIEARMGAPFAPPLWFPTALNRKLSRITAELEGVIGEALHAPRERDEGRPDMLSILLHARHETGLRGLDERSLRDECLTMLFAGHETTAMTLCWALHLLALHPHEDARLRHELDCVLGGRPPTVADLNQLGFTRMVLHEALRLYPPAWALTRRVRGDDEIGGFPIPGGALVTVSPWITHRRPGLWENPETFMPERFASNRAAALPRFAYFPFLGGPHQCIGMQLALLEAQLMLVTLVQHFRFKSFPLIPVIPEPSITLRPRFGLYFFLQPA
jgi:cytochrome P450